MTRSLRLPLPPPYGPLTVLETVDTVTGAVRYLVSARRLSGVFVFRPHPERDVAVPTRVAVEYGDGPDGHHRTGDRIDRPTVHGIDLIGGTVIDPARIEPLTRRDVTVHRSTGPLTRRPVPDRTADYVAAVIDTLRTHWQAQPGRDALMLTAARHSAPGRVRKVIHDELRPRRARRDLLNAEIHRYERLVEHLHKLAGMPATDATGADW
ncbi:hypothetical protein GCM10009827_118990 [Dactylosporangium maewongense]|uniref:Uncharacterized protein n=1 Tax=Dactylosporangium maewongense TaxID=634393 RepID=A0ABN2DKQ9_9ACTN